MQFLPWLLIFGVALATLLKSAQAFTALSERLGRHLGLSPFLVGLTVVAIGTSLPELLTGIMATAQGHTAMVAGNVLGANITNILLIGGVTAWLTRKAIVDTPAVESEMPLLLTLTAVLILTIYDGQVTRLESVLLLLSYVLYARFLVHNGRIHHHVEVVKHKSMDAKAWGFLALSLLGLYFGSSYTVKALIELAGNFAVAPEILSMTVLALGTTLPELVISIQAARKNQYSLVLGNILGSNIFNGTVVLGLSALIHPLSVSAPVLQIGLPFLVLASFLFAFSKKSQPVLAVEGGLYLLLFFVFLGQSATLL
jgi:cation:H+ antiporter